MKTTVEIGGRRIRLEDPLRTITVPLEIHEVESTIPAGFQIEWMSGGGDDTGLPEVELYAGAGLGSKWATIRYDGRSYCFDAAKLLQDFVDAEENAGPPRLTFNEALEEAYP